MRYPVILHTDDNKNFGVTVPDLPGCFSQGDSVKNALINAEEAILLHAETLIGDALQVPSPSDVIDLAEFHGNESQAFLAYVDVDVGALMGPVKRINVTFRHATLAIIDNRAAAMDMNRSEYLAFVGAANPGGSSHLGSD